MLRIDAIMGVPPLGPRSNMGVSCVESVTPFLPTRFINRTSMPRGLTAVTSCTMASVSPMSSAQRVVGGGAMGFEPGGRTPVAMLPESSSSSTMVLVDRTVRRSAAISGLTSDASQ